MKSSKTKCSLYLVWVFLCVVIFRKEKQTASVVTDGEREDCLYTLSQKQEYHAGGYIQPEVKVSWNPNTVMTSTFLFKNFIHPLLTYKVEKSWTSVCTWNIQSHFSAYLRALENCPAFMIEKWPTPRMLFLHLASDLDHILLVWSSDWRNKVYSTNSKHDRKVFLGKGQTKFSRGGKRWHSASTSSVLSTMNWRCTLRLILLYSLVKEVAASRVH